MPRDRKTRPVSWIKAALQELKASPKMHSPSFSAVAKGGKADNAKPMHGLGPGVFEIALAFRGDAFRVIWVAHAF